ncbi:TetR family transcriptional regulator [Klebsiella pneumoniae]|nr:TetR family transcriptional regulator [Klebsiella pneumoniae]
MTTTKQGRTPGRPRQFDAEQAIETAQRLFHARGYDAVSVADLTQAFGINPPSFYAAFGSKLGLYTRVLQRYSQTGAIPIDALLRDDQPVAASLIAVLQEAARRYVADPAAAGCLVLEGYIVRMLMPGWRQANGMLRQEPKSSSISPAIARRTRCG